MTLTSPTNTPVSAEVSAARARGRSGPLAGLVVLDLGQAAVAPLAATYLGLLGAVVIKVESPRGDMVRAGEPTMFGTSTTFIGNNWTKYAIRLDLKTEQGRSALEDLIGHADLLIENFRNPQVLPKLGFDHTRLAQLNPHLVYVESSAFGQAPPTLDGMISNEWITEAIGGMVSVTGSQDRAEFMRGTSLLDWSGAMVNTVVALAGLLQAQDSGAVTLRTSQLGSTLFAGITRFLEARAAGTSPGPSGSTGSYFAPDAAFATSDGWLGLCAPTQRTWERLCAALELPDLATDPAFADNTTRVANRNRLTQALESRLKEKPAVQWASVLAAAGLPHTLFPRERWLSDQLASDPQVAYGRHLLALPTAWGLARTAGPHWRFGRTPAQINGPSPQLGEHEELLRPGHSTQTDRVTDGGYARRDKDELAAVLDHLPLAGLIAKPDESGPAGDAGGRHDDRLAPLTRFTVVEVSTGLCAPLAGRVLAELGAHVVRIEPPNGDWLRAASRGNGPAPELFEAVNAGKDLRRADVTTAEGRAELAGLLAEADVLLTSLSPRALAAAGLDAATLAAEHPSLVHVQVTGWGAGGPKAGQGATELDMQATVGMYRHLGAPEAEPVRVGYDLVTVNTALAAGQAALAGLWERQHSAKGQVVETSMLATAVAISQWSITAESRPDRVRGLQLEGYDLPPDLGVLCADRRACRLDFRKRHDLWFELMAEVGIPDLADDPRFADEQAVNLHRHALSAALTEALAGAGWDYPRLERYVTEGGGTIVPVLTLDEVIDHPQVKALRIVDDDYPGMIRLPHQAIYANPTTDSPE